MKNARLNCQRLLASFLRDFAEKVRETVGQIAGACYTVFKNANKYHKIL